MTYHKTALSAGLYVVIHLFVILVSERQIQGQGDRVVLEKKRDMELARVTHIDWSQDGSELLVSMDFGRVELLSAKELTTKRVFRFESNRTFFAPDGRSLITARHNLPIQIVDILTEEAKTAIPGRAWLEVSKSHNLLGYSAGRLRHFRQSGITGGVAL